MRYQDPHKKSNLKPPPYAWGRGVWASTKKIFFAENCMKCPDFTETSCTLKANVPPPPSHP